MVTSCSGSVLPAVSSILPVISSTVINDVLASTLGRQELGSPLAADTLCSVGKASASKEVAGKSIGSSDGGTDEDSSSIESHEGGTVTPTRKKG